MFDKLKKLYIHRKNKDLIEVEITIVPEFMKTQYTIFKSDNGIKGKIRNDGIFSADQLPETKGNILIDAVSLTKYLNKNGYKSVTMISQTKNGVKFG